MLETETERLEAHRKRVTGGILRISSIKLPDILMVLLFDLQPSDLVVRRVRTRVKWSEESGEDKQVFQQLLVLEMVSVESYRGEKVSAMGQSVHVGLEFWMRFEKVHGHGA